MSDIIKVGSFDVTSIRVGSTPVDKVMVGDVKVYPQETPVTSYKWLATYVGGSVASAECDSTSAITQNEIAKTDLVSVEIGNCVKTLDTKCFSACTSLTSVTIPNSVTSIGDSAFTQCYSLSSVTIPNSVTSISNYTFHSCISLTSVTIPSGVTTIGNYAFDFCDKLSSVTIPDSVTTIGDRAFQYCYGLTSVTIGSGITSIGTDAFNPNDNITAMTINAITPPTLGNTGALIGTYPIYVPCDCVDAYKSAWSTYASRIKCSQTNRQITYLAASKANVNLNGFTPAATAETFENGLGRIEFADNVTSIGSGFSGKTSVTRIFLPDSVTEIGTSAFTLCRSLTSITIPDSVTSIGDYAFHSCNSIASIDIPSGVTTIGEDAFTFCYSLSSVTIPNSVTSIGRSSFAYCSGITNANISTSITTISISLFSNCYSLESIVIPSGVTEIKRSAFLNCSGLTAITVNATTPPTLGNSDAFDGTNNCPIYVPCASVSAYKAATNWSAHQSRIQCEGPVDYKTKYFTVTLENDGTIQYSSTTAASQVVYYSTDDGTNWTALQSRTSTPTISAGKKVLFKASGLAVNSTSGIGRFSATTNFSVEGNVMSLVSGDNFVNASEITKASQFRRLFYSILTLVDAENLVLPNVAINSTGNTYHQSFCGCRNLRIGPARIEMPSTLKSSVFYATFSGCSAMTDCMSQSDFTSATTLAENCYYYMFNGCKSLTALTSNPNQIMLSAAELKNQSYYGMFQGCSGLTQSVYIGCSSIPSGGSGLTQMMSGCTNITEIYCAATGIASSNLCGGSYSPTYMWVKGVASGANCKFHAHVGEQWSTDVTCMSQYYSSYPNGWTYVADIT